MESLTNICLDPFVVSIHSSSVSRDGYSPITLTSTDPLVRAKGFRVEHFIRPPISVEITFKYPVNVASIVLKPGLEKDAEARIVADGSLLAEIDSTTAGYVYNLHSGLVARGPDVMVHLKNRVFDRMWANKIAISRETVAMVKGSHMNCDHADLSHMIEQPLRHINITSRLRYLKVTVTRLTGVKPLVFKWMEVWGTLARNCSQSERHAFQAAVHNLQTNSQPAKPKISLFSSHNSDSSNQTIPAHAQTPEVNSSKEEQNRYITIDRRAGNAVRTSSLKVGCMKPTHTDTPGKSRKHDTPFPEAIYHGPSTKKQRMKEGLAEDSLKPLTHASHTGSSRGPAQQILDPNLSSINNNRDVYSLLSNDAVPPSLTSSDAVVLTDTSTSDSEGTPVKFLDALTYEVMLIPMILPSGHFVDRSTVDKLASNDAMYGRSPTDPFTGVAFKECSKPQFCPELKVEIDEFLTTQRAEEGLKKNSGVSQRTLGSASDISRHMGKFSTHPIQSSHPVSCIISYLGTPLKGATQCTPRDYSMEAEVAQRKSTHKCNGVKDDRDGSFESEVSCSLDAALNDLFSA